MKMYKKLLTLIFMVSLIFVLILQIQVYAAGINVTINGKAVTFTQSSGQPFIDSANRTQVPLRQTMEAFGCNVSWDSITKIATVSKDGTVVQVPIGKGYILKDGKMISNDTAAQIVVDRTYLPIRAVLEAFGAYVEWDSTLKTVKVTDGIISKKDLTDVSTRLIKKDNNYYYVDGGYNGQSLYILEFNNKYYTSSNLNLFNSLYTIFNGEYSINENNSGNPNVSGSIDVEKIKNVKIEYWNEYEGLNTLRYSSHTVSFDNGNKLITKGDSNKTLSVEPENIAVKVYSDLGTYLILDLEESLKLAGINKEVDVYYDNNMKCYVLNLD